MPENTTKDALEKALAFIGGTGGLAAIGVFVRGFFSGTSGQEKEVRDGLAERNEKIQNWPLPAAFGELLAGCVTMLGVHTVRGISADRANASNGIGPVPVGPSDPAQATAGPSPGRLPNPRPLGDE